MAKDKEQLKDSLREILLSEGGEGIDGIIEDMAQFVELIDGVKDSPLHLGSIEASFDDDYNVVVAADNGWSMKWPSGSEAWVILSKWIIDRDVITMGSFVKLIVFPTSVRLTDIDDQYLNDIVTAHASLTQRVQTSKL